MTPLQVHYRKGDYCWVLGSLGTALDEEGFGVGPTFDNHRGQNFILPLVLPEPCPVCTDFIPFSRRPCSLASPDKAGWHGGGRTVVPPRSVHDGEQCGCVACVACVAGREERKSRVKALSLHSAGVILSRQSCSQCLGTLYGAVGGRGEVLNAGEQPSPPGAMPWRDTISPVFLGREALARATQLFLAKSGFPWYCQEVPG